MTKKVKSYSPTYNKESSLNVTTKEEVAKRLPELAKVMNKEGRIKMKLNEDVMIQRVAIDLYKHPESSLRELYANSCRACRIAEKLGSKNPYVKISLNTKSRKLIVHDINSQGITSKIFAQILIKLGDSSNFDPTEIGQNGMGIASYGLLGDTMKLETKCMETKDCYAVLGKSGDMGFDVLDEIPNLEQTGTKISITLKPKTNYSKLVRTLKTLASVSGIKTHFELECDKGQEVAELRSGLHTLPQTTYKDIFKNSIQNDREYSYLTSSLVTDDIEVHLAVAVDTSGRLTNQRKKEVYVINNPIECLLDEDDHDNYNDTLDNAIEEQEDPDDYDDDDVIADAEPKPETKKEIYKRSRIDEIRFHSVVINLKNEREENGFRPKPDRERLTNEAETKIRKIIVDLYNETLRKVKPCKELSEWFDHEHKYFISSTNGDVLELIDARSKEINEFLNLTVWKYPENNVKKFNSVKLKDILEPENEKQLFYVWKKDKRVINLLDSNFEDHFTCIVQTKDTSLSDAHFKILHDFGFKEAKQYLKDNKIKAVRSIGVSEKIKGDLVLHYANYGDNSKTLNATDEKLKDLVKAQRIIRVEPFDNYRKWLQEFNNNDFYITISRKENEYLPSIADLEKTLENKTYLTNLGKLTLEEIVNLRKKERKEIKFMNEFDNNYYKFFEYMPKNILYVFDDSEIENKKSTRRYKRNRRVRSYDIDQVNLIRLGLVLTYKGITYDGNCDDNIEKYYEQKVEKFARTIKLNHGINQYSFDENISAFENCLIVMKQVDEQLLDPLLRTMFTKTVDYGNYKKISEQVLELQSRLGTKAKPILANPKGFINRPQVEYLK